MNQSEYRAQPMRGACAGEPTGRARRARRAQTRFGSALGRLALAVALAASCVAPSLAWAEQAGDAGASEAAPLVSEAAARSPHEFDGSAAPDAAVQDAQLRARAAAANWDVSAAHDGTLSARLAEVAGDGADAGSFELVFEGAGAMRDFSAADEAPWYEDYAQRIVSVRVGDGVSSVGSYALCLPNVRVVTGGNALSSIGSCAFAGAASLVALDLTQSPLATIAPDAFGATAGEAARAKRTIYVANAQAADAVRLIEAGSDTTALALAAGGTFPESTQFSSGALAAPVRAGYDFVGWKTDAELSHPATGWDSIAKNATFYASFRASQPPLDEPVAYPGFQGLDQTVQLLDLSKLPSLVVKNPDVLFYGAPDGRYDNRIVSPYNGNRAVEFAFIVSRGTNANGGDGTYQRSFVLPYISILDEAGQVVAAYEDGAGKLKLFETVFDNTAGKTQGYTITAYRIGLEPGALEDGTYTLRFGKDLGSNNGTSFLQKNVDFQFSIESSAQYALTYRTGASSAEVTGIAILDEGASGIDVEIPAAVEGVPVTGIAAGAFSGCARVSSVTVPESVRSIGAEAFARMESLSWVKVLSRLSNAPTWGADVFAGSPACTLFGYSAAQTVIDAAAASDAVSFVPLEDGIYVNGQRVESGDTVTLSAERPCAVVHVMSGAQDVTRTLRGYSTNVNCLWHRSSLPDSWSDLQAKASGSASVEVRDARGQRVATIGFTASGFSEQAQTDREVVVNAQGNGSTVKLEGAGVVRTTTYDETLSYFDNYLDDPVPAAGAALTFQLQGPGSAWDSSRWNWDDWTQNHLNPFIELRDETGARVAAIGSGLSWITLSSGNEITLSIDRFVMTPGKTYTLSMGEQLTGHNVAAPLQTEVRWTFEASAADISAAALAAVGACPETGAAVEPDLGLRLDTPEVTLWDEASEREYVAKPAGSEPLVAGRDFSVRFEDNVKPGIATAHVAGAGPYAGEAMLRFAVLPASGATSEYDRPDGAHVVSSYDHKTGLMTQVIEAPGGSRSVRTLSAQGAYAQESFDAAGGLVSVAIDISRAASEAGGFAVLSAPLPATASLATAPDVFVTSPAGTDVRIPLAEPSFGTVFVRPDFEASDVDKKCVVEGSNLRVRVADGALAGRAADLSRAFPDVTAGLWYADNGVVDFVSARRIVTGVTGVAGHEDDPTYAEFQGDAPMTRAMLAMVLYRLEGSPAVADAPTFFDVSPDAWYADAVGWAAAKGIVTGATENYKPTGYFNPDDMVTREQMSAMIFRYASMVGVDVSARVDLGACEGGSGVSPWARDYMSWAVAEGIISGKTSGAVTGLDAGGSATRAEVSTVLMRFLKDVM